MLSEWCYDFSQTFHRSKIPSQEGNVWSDCKFPNIWKGKDGLQGGKKKRGFFLLCTSKLSWTGAQIRVLTLSHPCCSIVSMLPEAERFPRQCKGVAGGVAQGWAWGKEGPLCVLVCVCAKDGSSAPLDVGCAVYHLSSWS